jgi:hypothetical protein
LTFPFPPAFPVDNHILQARKFPYFWPQIAETMKFWKLTALFSLLTVFTASCNKDFFEDVQYNNDITLNSAQVVPAQAAASPATGKATVSYNPKTRLLSYTLKWSGLASNPTVTIKGPADPGFASGTTIQSVTVTNSSTVGTGTATGNLYMDEVVAKESDLLNGKYYFQAVTTGYAAGEVRGQITFTEK